MIIVLVMLKYYFVEKSAKILKAIKNTIYSAFSRQNDTNKNDKQNAQYRMTT